jgi:hypothetical protein
MINLRVADVIQSVVRIIIKRISIGQATKLQVYMLVIKNSTLHDGKVTAWAAVSSSGVIGPFILNLGEFKAVNRDFYLHFLQNKFIPALHRRCVSTADF